MADKLYQTPPLTPLPVPTACGPSRRSLSPATSPGLLRLVWQFALTALSWPRLAFPHPSSCPAFPREGFADPRSRGAIPRGTRRCGTMRALTPLRLTTPERSLRLLRPAFRASRSQPLDGHAHRFDRHRSVSIFQGFALQSQARRTIPPKRIRQPTGYAFASCCSPPRLPPQEREPRPRDS